MFEVRYKEDAKRNKKDNECRRYMKKFLEVNKGFLDFLFPPDASHVHVIVMYYYNGKYLENNN